MKLFHAYSSPKSACWSIVSSFARFLFVEVNPFLIQLHYFVILSLLGFLALEVSKTRTQPLFKPQSLDLFFTSVSAITVSSMSTVEMEVFSNTQLIIMTILMLLGGEVFLSMIGLQLKRSRFVNNEKGLNAHDNSSNNSNQGIELGVTQNPEHETQIASNSGLVSILRYNKSTQFLSYVILCYLLVAHVIGAILVYMYLSFIKNTKELLSQRGLQAETFSIFTVVSTFANCGFIPTNENMVVFAENSGLLLILIPLALMGNTMYPVFLRILIWFLWKITRKQEFGFLLNKEDVENLGYDHLFPRKRSFFLGATVLGFILIQFVLFCSMEWNAEAMKGLSSFQKLVGSLFEAVSARHTGESIVDLSIVSPAILVLFTMMMYLPPYTSFLPIEEQEKLNLHMVQRKRRSKKLIDTILFSNLSYLVMFIILICFFERESMKNDPLNFNALNITLEVISAYGNVGFSVGYSCKRRIHHEGLCIEKLYGFAGKWSNKGKFMLILVMFFGRLKSFTMSGGRAWILA
ncbi:sodium transporter HKT1 [Impatiens glandulifera]|uniref:sodium transporter HKT1 n=1 Tax=Impatiens glandulifera TaxID=253017 RepID=UPI001FB120F2|nr:sodium transporter HKT1 [Impatiens glandulifera]